MPILLAVGTDHRTRIVARLVDVGRPVQGSVRPARPTGLPARGRAWFAHRVARPGGACVDYRSWIWPPSCRIPCPGCMWGTPSCTLDVDLTTVGRHDGARG